MVIRAVQKAMRILQVLSDASGPLSLQQIAQTVGEPKSTCAHLLRTLLADGYAEQTRRGGGYALGPAVYCLTRHGKYNGELVALCRPVMRYLYRKTGMTVVLSILQNDCKYIIDHYDPDVRYFPEVFDIRTDDLYRTATGRLLLANQDEQTVRAVYDRHGAPAPDHWPGVTSYESLLAALAQIDPRGVLIIYSHYNDSMSYAAPVRRDGNCLATLGVALPCTCAEYEERRRTDATTPALLRRAVHEIERRMKFSEE